MHRNGTARETDRMHRMEHHETVANVRSPQRQDHLSSTVREPSLVEETFQLPLKESATGVASTGTVETGVRLGASRSQPLPTQTGHHPEEVKLTT